VALVARNLPQEDPVIRMQRDARRIGGHPCQRQSRELRYWLRSIKENPLQAPGLLIDNQ
jgi:hypothetical protein